MAVHNPLAGAPLRAARWSAQHPWRAILGWLVFVAIATSLAVAVPTQDNTDADYRIGDSGQADRLLHEAGLAAPDAESVLVQSRAGGPLADRVGEAVTVELTTAMSSAQGVHEVSAPQWSVDRTAVLVSVQLDKGTTDAGPLEKVTSAVQAAHPELRVREAGDLTINDGVNDQVSKDLHSAEGISLPLTLILMLLAFGAVVAAGIPVLLALSSVAATIGITAPLSHLVHADPSVSSMIVLIGMAVGVDYSLFFLKRERQERAEGRATVDAVEIAAQTSGHSILVSGCAVVGSLAGLYVIGGAPFDSLATGAILVVAIAVLGSITVLPALLARLGRWADRPRLPLLWRLNARIGRGGISSRIIGPVVRRPAAALVLSVLVAGALALPALGMKIHASNLDTLPRGIPVVQTYRAMSKEFPSEGAVATVVVKSSAARRAAVVAALGTLERRALATADFDDAGLPPVRTSTDGTTSVLQLAMPYDQSSPQVDHAIEHLRDRLLPAAMRGLPTTYAVGGEAAQSLDSGNHLQKFLPVTIGFVLLLTMLMMGVAFRSAPIALISTGLNLLSVGVSFGVLTLAFQRGWGSSLLGFTSPGFVIDWLPVFILVVLVGLSMDYHVFVLSRVREHLRRGLPARLAVEQGVTDTAGVVTSAAAVMVSVFAIFATLSMLEMKMIGVGLSAAILVDATLIRLVMLPAILVLLGDRAWWPSRRGRPEGEDVVETEPGYDLVGATPRG